MRWIKEAEAKERFPELLEEVAQGETVVILRGSLKIAKIVPDDERSLLEVSEEEDRRRKEAVDNLREWKRKRGPTGTTIEEILEWRRGDPFKESQ